MRVAYISADPGVPVFGRKGSSVHVQEIMRAMLAYGARVDLFAPRLGGEAPPDLEQVVIHQLPAIPKGDLSEREAASIMANQDLDQSLRREGPFDLVYERYSLWSFAGMAFARCMNVPALLEVNAPLIEEQTRHRGLLNRLSVEMIAREVFHHASFVLAVSREVAGYVGTFGIDLARVHVIPNGVNKDRFAPGLPASLPAANGVFTVGFVGTLKPWHGLPSLVESFDVLHRHDAATRLLIVGDGIERERTETDLAARGLSRATHFTGAVDPSAIPGLIASMDVAVAPYPADPSFYFSPLKVFEYMAAGVPVVASGIGQLAELIDDGRNGLLYPPGDAIALAEAVNRLRREPDLRASLSRAARATVLQGKTWDAIVRRVFQLAGVEPVRERVFHHGAA